MRDEAGQRGVLLRLVSLASDNVKKLATAMSRLQVMRSPNSRQQVLDWVTERNPDFHPSRSNRDLEEITSFIRACKTDDESFDLLLEAIEMYSPGDDPDLSELKKLVNELLPRAALTKEEFKGFLALKPDTIVGRDKLAVGIRKALPAEASREGRDLNPANAREAMLLILDAPSPTEGLRRLLRFVNWLADSAAVLCDDPSIAGQLRELGGRVGRAHGVSTPQVSEEDTGADSRLAEQRSGSPEPANPGESEHAEREVIGPERPQYLVGDNDIAPATLSSHERALRELGDALERIVPRIFRDPRIRRRELAAANKALGSLDPLMTALRAAAEEETHQPIRDDLWQLDDNLRRHHQAVSQELAALAGVRSERAARSPCDRLADEAVDLLDAGRQAIDHVT